jgi:hypothetical protein
MPNPMLLAGYVRFPVVQNLGSEHGLLWQVIRSRVQRRLCDFLLRFRGYI